VVGTSGRQRVDDHIGTIDTGTVDIKTSDSVKSLRVVIDSTLSFNQHVDNICKVAHFHIKAFCHIRKLLPDDAAKTVASAVVAVWYHVREHRQVAASAECTGQSCQQHTPA